MGNPEDHSLDALSELARQRREEAAEQAEKPRPNLVSSVDQSEIYFTFLPSAIPLRMIDLDGVSSALESRYGVSLTGPDYSPLLAMMPREQLLSLDEEEMKKRLVRSGDATLKWADGRFPLRNDFVRIISIVLNYETIIVAVEGVSQVAEVVAKEVLELLWETVGSRKTFTKDLEPLLQLTGYGTGTRINLGEGLESFMNPAVIRFLDQNLSKGRGYAAKMGRVKQAATSEGFYVVSGVRNLEMEVRRFDPRTGQSESSRIAFQVTATSDFRTGRIYMTSELPYEQHIQLVEDLVSAVTLPPST